MKFLSDVKLPRDPLVNIDAATKKYVDDANLEVVNARTSTIKNKVFDNVKARLEEIESDIVDLDFGLITGTVLYSDDYGSIV